MRKKMLTLTLCALLCLTARAEGPVDLDLTKFSGTVVYSQVYDMMMEPETYLGQRVRVEGSLSYYKDSAGNEYFAALIADATACCAQGIEFVWAGEHASPQDYPPLGTDVTVTESSVVRLSNRCS